MYTLQICAVLASHTAKEHNEPYVEKSVLQALHPMLLNKQWVFDYQDLGENDSRSVVTEHIEFLIQ